MYNQSCLLQASNNKKNITSIMATWTEQMGYPVVSVLRTGMDVTMAQSRFLLNNDGNVPQTSPYK